MRDSFGGLFMLNLFIVFIFIYVAFSALSLNYAKAFRLKNSIISFVEEKEIISLEHSDISNKLDELDEILENANYNKTCDSVGSSEGEIKEGSRTIGYCHNGVVIRLKDMNGEPNPKTIEGTTSKQITYEIITAANWNLGVLNKLLALGGNPDDPDNTLITGFWKIKGEAKVVKRN